jgi:hypothetical protein
MPKPGVTKKQLVSWVVYFTDLEIISLVEIDFWGGWVHPLKAPYFLSTLAEWPLAEIIFLVEMAGIDVRITSALTPTPQVQSIDF